MEGGGGNIQNSTFSRTLRRFMCRIIFIRYKIFSIHPKSHAPYINFETDLNLHCDTIINYAKWRKCLLHHFLFKTWNTSDSGIYILSVAFYNCREFFQICVYVLIHYIVTVCFKIKLLLTGKKTNFLKKMKKKIIINNR